MSHSTEDPGGEHVGEERATPQIRAPRQMQWGGVAQVRSSKTSPPASSSVAESVDMEGSGVVGTGIGASAAAVTAWGRGTRGRTSAFVHVPLSRWYLSPFGFRYDCMEDVNAMCQGGRACGTNLCAPRML